MAPNKMSQKAIDKSTRKNEETENVMTLVEVGKTT
jgi:hypothetical protein